MIKYSLACSNRHIFTSWFRSSEDFDEQKRRGFLECPMCRSTAVDKAVMAPSVARRDLERGAPSSADPPPVAETGRQMALLDEDALRLRSLVRELRAKIMENSTDVGDQFADQARRMHEGEIPTQLIRGETTAEEARALLEGGVPIMPIPSLPDEQN